MKNQKKLLELKTDDKIDHYLLVTKLDVKTAKNGRQYLDLILRDESAGYSAKMWDGFSSFVKNAKEEGVVKVKGKLESFNNQPQIKIFEIRVADISDGVNAEDFLPKSQRNLEEMKKELDEIIKSVKNIYLQKLLKDLLSGERYEKYIRVPAGKSWHHAYIHGLLEHTLEIVKICELMCNIHSHLDRDLLIAGTLLHDFGKTEELSSAASFDYTTKGKLLGHIVIAAMSVESTAKKIEGFPDDLLIKLIHLILSHQGKLEHATPVEPKTVEAIALYHADELSAKTNAYTYAIKKAANTKTGWTNFLPLAGTALLVPEKNNEPKETLFD